MAANVNDALDKNTDVKDRLDPSLFLPQGQAFDYIFVLNKASGNAYWASKDQVRAQLFPAAPANQSPVVTLAISKNGIPVGQSTVFDATATDPDGVIVAGTFNIDGVPVAVLTTGPFTFTYTPTSPNAVGTHQVEFVGLDNGGATGRASLPLVVIGAPVVADPPAQLTFAPVGNKQVGATGVVLSATSTNTVTPITFVSSNGAAVTVTNNGGTYTATFPAAGTSTLAALQAAGNGYAAGNASQVVTVSAAPTQKPTVALEISQQTITQGGSTQLTATPTSTNSTIASVAFFDGTTQIGQPVTAAPWQITYTPTATGQRQLTAKATDALGVVSNASNVQVLTVNAAPVVFTQKLDPSGATAPYFRDTLTYDPASQGVLFYNNPVQTSASTPGSSTMYLCYPTLNDIIGQLDFDPLDAGHAFKLVLGGTDYTTDANTGNALGFTNGKALLAL